MTTPLDEIAPAEIGERLRIARETAKITQADAATVIGVARTTLVAIEGGDRQPRPEELVALAQLYGVGVHSFLRPSAVRVDLVGQFRRKRTGREHYRRPRLRYLLRKLEKLEGAWRP